MRLKLAEDVREKKLGKSGMVIKFCQILPFQAPCKIICHVSGLWKETLNNAERVMRLKIGELAKVSGLAVSTIRFYEKEGLISCPDRSTGNFRIYDNESVERLRFIRHCRQQKMPLDEIKKMLGHMSSNGGDCGEIHQLIDSHVARINSEIEELVKLRDMLLKKREEARCESENECGILKGFAQADDCAFCQKLKLLRQGADK